MPGIISRFSVGVRGSTAWLIAAALAVSFTQMGSGAEILDPLPYSRGYLLTGNYVVSGVDVTEQQNPQDVNGLSTGEIHIAKCTSTVTTNCVPSEADVVAAFLYWEAIIPTAAPSQAAGVTFRGEEILLNDVMAVKASSQELTGSTASCWSSGSPLTMVQFRADVLRLLPIRLDKDNNPTTKRLVTDEDLDQAGLPPHRVQIPTRNGNQIPESAGASLLLVYRDPAEVLRKIVIFDGIHIQASIADTMTQRLRGFYKSAAPASAKVTQIIASGQPNNNERVYFNRGDLATTNTPLSPTDAIPTGSSSERGWANLTYDVSSHMSPPSVLPNFGETVTTSVRHTPANGGYDCLTWGAIIFSTAVADVDHDGLPDGLEDSSTVLRDPPSIEFPQGQPLPLLNAMGTGNNPVGSDDQDVFVEINAMQTTATKNHGSSAAPYPGSPTAAKPVPAHTHMPSPEVLALIGDAYWTRGGIRVHFDVGNIDAYKARGQVEHTYLVGTEEHIDWVDDYGSDDADKYLVPTLYAKGGEVIDERACTSANCQFPDYPGAVSWKVGMQLYRDSPVDDATGAEFPLSQAGEITVPNTWQGRRRFDRNRKGFFHYLLYAHYRGKPKSDLPCVNTQPNPDVPIPYPNNGTTCTGTNIDDNPEFHIPSSASGVADLPGGNAMITLGFWDDFMGRPIVQASTTFHELGHNYNLWHGGKDVIWGNKFEGEGGTSTIIEPNCKPNYLSSMSYQFQVHGLFKDDDSIHLDFSGDPSSPTPPQGPLSESTPEIDAPFSPTPNPPYRPAWYAPFGSELATSLGVPEAKRYCHGEAFGVNPHMARVYTETSAASIDWNGDGNDDPGDTTQANTGQDINLDHAVNGTLASYNDWRSLRLDQISAGRNAVKFQDGDFFEFGSGDFFEFGSGDFYDFGSGDFFEFGSGDFYDFGSGAIMDAESGDFFEFGSGDFFEFGSGDFYDFGSGDFFEFGSGSPRQELDFELAKDLARSVPYSLRGCIIAENAAPDCVAAPKYDPNHHRTRTSWRTPTFGRISLYQVFRKWVTTPPVEFPTTPTGTSPIAAFIDPDQLPDGEEFAYRARARFDDNVLSGFSKTVTQEARNDVPELNGVNGSLDTYTVVRNRTLNVTNPGPPTPQNPVVGVRNNDRDPDSPQTAIVVQRAPTPPNSPETQGTVTLFPDGTFTYIPRSGFTGLDYFYYTATNGMWSVDPSVPMNNVDEIPAPVQVVINVTPPK
jgi:hypothetical protein